MINKARILFLGFVVFLTAVTCNLPETAFGENHTPIVFYTPAENGQTPAFQQQGDPLDRVTTPTPNPPRTLPPIRSVSMEYTIQSNDTLNEIARDYGVSPEAIVIENNLPDPNILSIGQVLVIPPPTPGVPGPAFKIIPDSELVYGPYSADFDLQAFIEGKNGYLSTYQEEVNEEMMSSVEIIELASRNYSVNPRLLLAIVEYQSGWVTQPEAQITNTYAIGLEDPARPSLYRQLTWTADNLNRGYYRWRVNALGSFLTTNGLYIPASPEINAGTAGVQFLLAQLLDEPVWRVAVSEQGLFSTFYRLFGNPFDWAYEPLIPDDLNQPMMQLPFEDGVVWTFTGGPHGGYDNGSAWAAIDFAPPKEKLGCTLSDEWVVAMADGVIIRSENGIVVQDLDGDGTEGTGWSILYLHIESREKVEVGTYVQAGDRIGHPSCEGGYSTGTHVHIARRYNGEWIPADQDIPFVLDGWVSGGDGILYEGTLTKGEMTIEPCQCRDPEHTIER
ncbi:MAG: LysM peptidoglycan-binding domain-containing M23 family metallopeptidase [Anaerolineales bacterium]|jgi:murein DD-endopeptidase MepM/ murein hydrolase activator NlpD